MNYDVVLWEMEKIKGNRVDNLFFSRLGIVLKAQLSVNGLELAESLSSWDK